MSLNLISNSTLKGSPKLPDINAPLPSGAALFADFSGSRFVMKYATGQVKRGASAKEVISFLRSSPATRIGPSGLIEYLMADEPAIEYHPVTHECLGIRAESVSNSRIAWSQDFTQAASWTPSGVTLTANDAVSPDGNTTATKLIETAGSTASVHTLLAITTLAATSGQPYTFSIWAKANTGNVLQIAAQGAVATTQFVNFDLKNGKIGKSSPQVLQATMQEFKNGWYRCAITITPTSSVSPQFTLVLTGSDASAAALPSYIPTTPGSVYIWGAQPERRDGASSYIPTSGAEASRAADICTTPTNYDAVSSDAGTILITCVQPHSNQCISGTYNALACATVLDNSAAGESLRLSYRPLTTTNGQAQWATADASGTSQSLEIYSMCPVRDSEQTAIFSFDKPTMTMKLFDGFNWYSRTVTQLPSALNRVCIGRSYIGPENWFNGYIKKLIYWPQSLTEQEMEEAISYQ
ncbi:phage head spike fiber domain-containing protein [Klebsiella pneumoniae]